MKFRSPGNERVIEMLKSMGAQALFDGCMEDVYFAHPDRDFGITDEAVRLRLCSTSAELTYKGPRMKTSTAKAREELTVSVDDGLAVRRLLERLGFSEFVSVKKRRASFLLDKVRVEVDEVDASEGFGSEDGTVRTSEAGCGDEKCLCNRRANCVGTRDGDVAIYRQIADRDS